MLKKLIIIILIIAAILFISYLYPTSNLNTEITCYGHSKSQNGEYVTIYLLHNERSITNPNNIKHIPVRKMPLFVNLTDEENKTKSYNLTTDSRGQAKIMSLEKMNYNVSIIFEGKYIYNPSKWEGTVNLKNQNSNYEHESPIFN